MRLAALQQDFESWLRVGSDAAAARFGERAKPGLLVYQNNYRAQLVACLTDIFERVQSWLGEAAFLAAVATHIDRTPPTSWTLDAYSLDFPATLARLYADDPEVAELAWLDWALADAFVGPDTAPPAAEDLTGVDWDQAVIQLTPTLRLGPARTNAAAIWSALSADAMPPGAELLPHPAQLLVWRQDYVSCFRAIEAAEMRALAQALAGESFGTICAALVTEQGEADGIATASGLLGQWLRDGLVSGVSVRGG